MPEGRTPREALFVGPHSKTLSDAFQVDEDNESEFTRANSDGDHHSSRTAFRAATKPASFPEIKTQRFRNKGAYATRGTRWGLSWMSTDSNYSKAGIKVSAFQFF